MVAFCMADGKRVYRGDDENLLRLVNRSRNGGAGGNVVLKSWQWM